MSRNFKIEDYETVEDRLLKFWTQYPNGRVSTWLERAADDSSWVIFGASIYAGPDDRAPLATGFAHEREGVGMVNKTSHVENAETSAIGRALANANYATKGKRPSREEMAKVAAAEAVVTDAEAHALLNLARLANPDAVPEAAIRAMKQRNYRTAVDRAIQAIKERGHDVQGLHLADYDPTSINIECATLAEGAAA